MEGHVNHVIDDKHYKIGYSLACKCYISNLIVLFLLSQATNILFVLSQFNKCDAAIFCIGHTTMHFDEVLRYLNRAHNCHP